MSAELNSCSQSRNWCKTTVNEVVFRKAVKLTLNDLIFSVDKRVNRGRRFALCVFGDSRDSPQFLP